MKEKNTLEEELVYNNEKIQNIEKFKILLKKHPNVEKLIKDYLQICREIQNLKRALFLVNQNGENSTEASKIAEKINKHEMSSATSEMEILDYAKKNRIRYITSEMLSELGENLETGREGDIDIDSSLKQYQETLEIKNTRLRADMKIENFQEQEKPQNEEKLKWYQFGKRIKQGIRNRKTKKLGL